MRKSYAHNTPFTYPLSSSTPLYIQRYALKITANARHYTRCRWNSNEKASFRSNGVRFFFFEDVAVRVTHVITATQVNKSIMNIYTIWCVAAREPLLQSKSGTIAAFYRKLSPRSGIESARDRLSSPVDRKWTTRPPVHTSVVCDDCYCYTNYLVMSYKIAVGHEYNYNKIYSGIMISKTLTQMTLKQISGNRNIGLCSNFDNYYGTYLSPCSDHGIVQ